MANWLNVEQVAEMLNLPKSFVYDRTRRNAPDPIPHKKVGKYLLFDPEEVRQWVQQHSR